MSQKERKIIFTTAILAVFFGIAPTTQAMHIMEGYLPAKYSILWGIVCLPFVIAGFFSVRRKLKENRKSITMLAMCGAFIFVISSIKVPSVAGSCSHMTGMGLGAILFGPGIVSILGLIVMFFQAVLLSHGGLSSLGANTFSMAITGPALSYGIYWLGNKCKVNKKISVFLAAMLGDLFTYCVASVQLGIAFPAEQGGIWASSVKFLSIYTPIQLPLAVLEGVLTVIIMMGLEKYKKTLPF